MQEERGVSLHCITKFYNSLFYFIFNYYFFFPQTKTPLAVKLELEFTYRHNMKQIQIKELNPLACIFTLIYKTTLRGKK